MWMATVVTVTILVPMKRRKFYGNPIEFCTNWCRISTIHSAHGNDRKMGRSTGMRVMKHPTKTSFLHVHLATCPQKKSIDLRHNSSLGLSGLSSFFSHQVRFQNDFRTAVAPKWPATPLPVGFPTPAGWRTWSSEGSDTSHRYLYYVWRWWKLGLPHYCSKFQNFWSIKNLFFGSYTSLSLIWFPLIFTDRSTNSTIWQTNMTGRLYPIVRFSNPPIPQSGQFMFDYRRVHSLISYYPLSSFIFHSNSINISFIQPMDFTLDFSVTHRSNFSDLRLLSAHELITHLLINSMQGTRQLNTVSRAMFSE